MTTSSKAVKPGKSPEKIAPQALGPDSLAWKHAGDNLQLLMAGTTLLLQVSHPVVGAGVGEHSSFKTDPWGRLQRTAEWGMRLMYGGQEGSLQAGKDLRDLHRDIKGADDKGRKYFALDPEAYTWVHMTTYYTMVTTQRLFGERPFTLAEQEQLYREWLQQGRVLGIRDVDMPQDLPAFWRYFNNMIETRLENTETARYLLDVTLKKMKRPPQMKWIPNSWWNAMYRKAGNWAKLNTYATLPPALRKTLGIRWDQRLNKRFSRAQSFVRRALPLLPARVRYVPPVYQSLSRKQLAMKPVKSARRNLAA